ncbi:MAG: fibrobacter succinogenes major paralogous domain-containing protein, partial [Flavobacteriales bacterium]
EIGGLMWSISNLNVEEFRNGDLIPEARTNEEWIAYGKTGQAALCYYDNDSVNGEKFGKLYNWHAVHDPRGLAPSGWHIPTNEEWLGLNKTLGRNIGCKMKSTEGWRPNCIAFCKNELNSNSSGFTALPGGERWSNGTFKNMGCSGDWWSVSESKYAYWPNSEDGLKLSNDDSGCGYYVRCIRDDRFQ